MNDLLKTRYIGDKRMTIDYPPESAAAFCENEQPNEAPSIESVHNDDGDSSLLTELSTIKDIKSDSAINCELNKHHLLNDTMRYIIGGFSGSKQVINEAQASSLNSNFANENVEQRRTWMKWIHSAKIALMKFHETLDNGLATFEEIL